MHYVEQHNECMYNCWNSHIKGSLMEREVYLWYCYYITLWILFVAAWVQTTPTRSLFSPNWWAAAHIPFPALGAIHISAVKLGVKAPNATTKCGKECEHETSSERRLTPSNGFPLGGAARVSMRERLQTRIQTLVYLHLLSIGACALVRLLCQRVLARVRTAPLATRPMDTQGRRLQSICLQAHWPLAGHHT